MRKPGLLAYTWAAVCRALVSSVETPSLASGPGPRSVGTCHPHTFLSPRRPESGSLQAAEGGGSLPLGAALTQGNPRPAVGWGGTGTLAVAFRYLLSDTEVYLPVICIDLGERF